MKALFWLNVIFAFLNLGAFFYGVIPIVSGVVFFANTYIAIRAYNDIWG